MQRVYYFIGDIVVFIVIYSYVVIEGEVLINESEVRVILNGYIQIVDGGCNVFFIIFYVEGNYDIFCKQIYIYMIRKIIM